MADLKKKFIKEVSKICDCETTKAALGVKNSISILLGYLFLMLMTAGFCWFSASQGLVLLFSVFSFLIGIEILIFQCFTGFVVLMTVTYYAAIIAQRGWNRYTKV